LDSANKREFQFR